MDQMIIIPLEMVSMDIQKMKIKEDVENLNKQFLVTAIDF
jgi:hypothetical protein